MEPLDQHSEADGAVRARISAALHDTALQSILVAKQELLEVDVPEVMRAIEALDGAVAELRAILAGADVREAAAVRALDEPPLGPFLIDAARRSGLAISLTFHPTARDVPPMLRYVVRELLINTAKHANAQHVWVSVAGEDDDCVVVFRDDGVGFDPAREGDDGHLGLALARARIAELGGTLDIVGAPGTTVTIRVPDTN